MNKEILENDIVKINPDTYLKNNRKRAKWIENHLEESFRVKIKKVDFIPGKIHVYSLIPNNSYEEIIWLFQDFELVKLEGE